MLDSIFSFTDFPIRMLIFIGLTGLIFSIILGLIIFINALGGYREVPGYATTVLVVLFFGALNVFGLGLVGGYAWRAYENTKKRPLSVVAKHIISIKKNKKISGSNTLINKLRLYDTKKITDHRGSLTSAEYPSDLPFSPKRYFIIYDIPTNEIRGGHAHLACEQYCICVKGNCSILIDDSLNRQEVILDSPNKGLYIPSMLWNKLYAFSPGSVLIVLASHLYDPADYIHEYDTFVKQKNA